MPVAKKIADFTQRSSWIRQMFEEGARLAQIHGRDKVFDFSLGNPNVEPPPEFQRVIEEVVRDPTPGRHGYMSNAGFPEVREAVATYLSQDQGVPVPAANVVMTCGAGGALNVIFKAILDPGDEVIVSRPYFVEYDFYVDNHGGVLRPVASGAGFDLDIDAIDKAIGPQTRAVLVNSPNNPTGRIYPAGSLQALGDLLRRKCAGDRPHHLPGVRRALSPDRLRRASRAAGHGRVREHDHRHELLQGAVAARGADRVSGGEPGDSRSGDSHGGAGAWRTASWAL